MIEIESTYQDRPVTVTIEGKINECFISIFEDERDITSEVEDSREYTRLWDEANQALIDRAADQAETLFDND